MLTNISRHILFSVRLLSEYTVSVKILIIGTNVTVLEASNQNFLSH